MLDIEKILTYHWHIIRGQVNADRLGVLYRKYYFAVAYLMQIEGMKFEDVAATQYTLDDVLKKIETMKL